MGLFLSILTVNIDIDINSNINHGFFKLGNLSDMIAIKCKFLKIL